jgi:hypothetical protein
VLFGEAQGRIIVSTDRMATVLDAAKAYGVPATVLGSTTPADQGLVISGAGAPLRVPLATIADAYHGALERAMSAAAPVAAEGAR